MAITTLFDNKWFSSHLKLRLHIAQLTLVLLAIILTGIRIKFKVGPVTRSDTIAIVMVLHLHVATSGYHIANIQM